RDDAQTLYGFATKDERTTFQVLLGTHGVGPSMAMAILATHPPAVLVDIVAEGDIGALTLVPGVGKKTAERLLVELKSRLSIPVLDGDKVPAGGGSAPPPGSPVNDVREALAGLGYSADEIRAALQDLPTDTDS